MKAAYKVPDEVLSESRDSDVTVRQNPYTLSRLTSMALWDGLDSLHQFGLRLKVTIAWILFAKSNEDRVNQNALMTKLVRNVDGLAKRYVLKKY